MGQKHRSADEATAWYLAHRDELPRFPEKPGRRAPRRAKGKAIGAPVH